MSVAMHFASGHSASAAKASRPVPVPMSAMLPKRAPLRSSRSSAVRQPVVVACWPVPKARPASISNAIAPVGHALAVHRRVDVEAAGADRLQPGLAHRHPVGFAQLLDLGLAAAQPAQSSPARRRRVHGRNKRGSAIRRASTGSGSSATSTGGFAAPGNGSDGGDRLALRRVCRRS